MLGLIDIFIAFSFAISFIIVMQMGALFNALSVYLVVGAVLMVGRTAWLFAKGRANLAAYTRPGGQAFSLFSVVANVSFAVTACVLVRQAIVTAQFPKEEYDTIVFVITAATVVFVGCACVPAKSPSLGFAFMHIGLVALMVTELARFHSTPRFRGIGLRTPFAEPFHVVHGGRSKVFNSHYRVPSQQYAVDLVVAPEPFRVGPAPTRREDFPCWGVPVLSPIDGVVVATRSDLRDVRIGDTDAQNPLGNHVIIEAEQDRFVTLAHLEQDSVLVQPGDTVRAGQRVGACGNSGNTSEPHLHLQVQTHADVFDPESRALPFTFVGVEAAGQDVVPRRNVHLVPTSTTAE